MIKFEIQKYFNYLNERHWIYIERHKNGKDWPWTKDKILQEYKFCEVFRELDTGTKWLRENWLEPYADDENLFFNICLYRQFNWWPTAEAIGYTNDWQSDKVVNIVLKLQEQGERVYTNAHMLGSTFPQFKGMRRIHQTAHICSYIQDNMATVAPSLGDTLEMAYNKLLEVKGFGPFLTYEVITDLRHTRYLNQATDIMTWANPGPGAMRGINRIKGLPIGWNDDKTKFAPVKVKGVDYIAEMRKLLELSVDYLEEHVDPFEMRDIEHGLCEFDKYERVRTGQGRPRLNYKPPHLR